MTTSHEAFIAWLCKVLMVAIPIIAVLIVIISAVAIYGAAGRDKEDGD